MPVVIKLGSNLSLVKIKYVVSIALTILSLTAISQDISRDSLVIRTFSNAEFRASELNYSATEDEDGVIYFGNENGVLEYDGSRWRLHSTPDYSYINQVQIGPNGRLFVGGRDQFGFMDRDSLGNMVFTSVREQLPDSLKLGECWQIVIHKGRTYFQTYEGIVRWDGELAHYLPIENAWFLPLGDQMLVSVIEKGIARLDGDSLSFLNTELKFENDNPHSLLPYRGSELVVATEYNGLFLIDTTTFESQRWDVPVNKTLMETDVWVSQAWNDSTYIISLIDERIIWVNNHGDIIKTIGSDEGLKDGESLYFLKDSKGDLWIPGLGIHHVFWPASPDLSNLKTQIRSATFEDKKIHFSFKETDLPDLFEPLREVSFQFATPGIDRVDLEFSTYLDGHDLAWSGWNDNPNREYTNLEGGEYTFSVKSRTPDGKEFPQASLSFFIETPWHKTGWAKFFGGIAVWLLIVGLYRVRTLQLRQKNERLEMIIAERTSELQRAYEQLSVKNQELDQFVRRVSHDLVAPMKSVKALVQITREEENPSEQERCFQMIESSLSKQEQFIRRMLDQAVNYRDVKQEALDFHKTCKDAIDSLSHFEGADQIHIELEIEKGFEFVSDPDRVKIVATNLITNAIKYRKLESAEARLNISAKKTDKEVIIEFADNGVGIMADQLTNIFQIFKRASLQSHGSGLGLYITKDMMEKMGGSIEVESQEGEGTRFVLTFPIVETSL